MVQTAENFRKIGLLGGTFDPVHNGHLAVADHVIKNAAFDEVWFIPASLPPHKPGHTDGQAITSFEHRYAMLQLATAGYSNYAVSNIEAKRKAPSYSIDTLNILKSQTGEQEELYFIIGVDAFLEIDTWKRFLELPDLVHFLIITRPGYLPDRVGELIHNYFGRHVYDPVHKIWSSKHGSGSFILQYMEPVPISSTDIRRKIRKNESVSDMVPTEIEDYIRKKGLYI